MTCTNCGREGPEGRFCTFCGTRQGSAATGARRRFAAAPNEPVVSVSLLTTMFPHLAEREVNEFRVALLVGMAVLVGLYAIGLITAALVVAAILVPALYVMYLYETRAYGDAPAPVTLATLGGGFAVGVVATIVLDGLVGSRQAIGRPGGSIDLGALLFAAAVVPLAKEVLKPIPALLLRRRPEFAQSVDGLVFGIAAGLGYAAAETVIHFADVITGLPVRSESGLWIVPLATVGVLQPLLHGSTTGLITAALWRYRGGRLPRVAAPAILAALVCQVAFALGSQLIEAALLSPVVQLIWQAIVVGASLTAVRLFLDHLLREEAAEMGLAEVTCANCGAAISGAGFCTVCGVALAATPRQAAVSGSRSRTAGAAR